MLNLIRQVLAVVLVITAAIGLAPMIPKTLGFQAVTVNTSLSGTIYPAANTAASRFVNCVQYPTSIHIRRNTNYTGYFSCTNNWVSNVTVVITVPVAGQNGTGLTLGANSISLPPGTTNCIAVSNLRAGSNTGTATNTVVYNATVNSATATNTDFYMTFQFTGGVRVSNAGSAPACP